MLLPPTLFWHFETHDSAQAGYGMMVHRILKFESWQKPSGYVPILGGKLITDLSSEMSKVPKPRASKPGPKRGGRTRKGPKRPQQPNSPSAPRVPGLLDQSNPLSTPMPKKRGRKSKADLLLLKLSKGLDQPESPHPKMPPEDFETPPGERPRRRAAQV